MKIATKSKFSIDGTEARIGYTFGQTWNGWACPYFELETALEIAKACSLPSEGYTVTYNAEIDAFEMNEGYEVEDVYNVEAQTINTIDGPKTVYGLGFCGWVWDNHAFYGDNVKANYLHYPAENCYKQIKTGRTITAGQYKNLPK